jgi:hypothetical protein
MGEVIFLRHGLFGPKTSRAVPDYSSVNKLLRSLMRFLGRGALLAWKVLRAVGIAIWMLLLMVAMIPGLVLYAVFFLFLLALGFGIIFEVGKAFAIVAS